MNVRITRSKIDINDQNPDKNPLPAPVLEVCTITYTFTAEEPDELTVQEGDVVDVLGESVV